TGPGGWAAGISPGSLPVRGRAMGAWGHVTPRRRKIRRGRRSGGFRRAGLSRVPSTGPGRFRRGRFFRAGDAEIIESLMPADPFFSMIQQAVPSWGAAMPPLTAERLLPFGFARRKGSDGGGRDHGAFCACPVVRPSSFAGQIGGGGDPAGIGDRAGWFRGVFFPREISGKIIG